MLSPELLAEIKRIEWRARRTAASLLLGPYQSRFRGQGMEFDEVREYVPGDDIRAIDWNVTARSGLPHVKTFREERESTLMLVVDTSASMSFGTKHKLKRTVAAELAAILTLVASRHEDRTGLLAFADEIAHFVPPSKGRAHVWNLVRQILTLPEGGGSNMSLAMEQLLQRQKKRCFVIIISDFLFDFPERLLRKLATKHDLLGLRVVDPWEQHLPEFVALGLVDPELGSVFEWRGRSQRVIQEKVQQHLQTIPTQWRRFGVDLTDVPTNEPLMEPLMRLFAKPSRAR